MTGTDRTPGLACLSPRGEIGAWLLDVSLVGTVVSVLGNVVGMVSLVGGSPAAANLAGANGLAAWLYRTGEGSGGQSAGKRVLDLRVTDERGESIDYPTTAIQAVGKAFLLPVDCPVGWLAMDGEYVTPDD